MERLLLALLRCACGLFAIDSNCLADRRSPDRVMTPDSFGH